jgi:hypothetical protein
MPTLKCTSLLRFAADPKPCDMDITWSRVGSLRFTRRNLPPRISLTAAGDRARDVAYFFLKVPVDVESRCSPG